MESPRNCGLDPLAFRDIWKRESLDLRLAHEIGPDGLLRAESVEAIANDLRRTLPSPKATSCLIALGWRQALIEAECGHVSPIPQCPFSRNIVSMLTPDFGPIYHGRSDETSMTLCKEFSDYHLAQLSRFLGTLAEFDGPDYGPGLRYESRMVLLFSPLFLEFQEHKDATSLLSALGHYQRRWPSGSLVRQILEAFRGIERPDDSELINSSVDNEAAAHALLLRGVSWSTMHPLFPLDMTFLTSKAYRYFLPAELVANLELGDYDAELFLDPSITGDAALADRFRQRNDSLTSSQRNVVISFMRTARECNAKELASARTGTFKEKRHSKAIEEIDASLKSYWLTLPTP